MKKKIVRSREILVFMDKWNDMIWRTQLVVSYKSKLDQVKTTTEVFNFADIFLDHT